MALSIPCFVAKRQDQPGASAGAISERHAEHERSTDECEQDGLVPDAQGVFRSNPVEREDREAGANANCACQGSPAGQSSRSTASRGLLEATEERDEDQSAH